MVKPVDMSTPSLLPEVAAVLPRYNNTRGVAAATALAPPPSAAAAAHVGRPASEPRRACCRTAGLTLWAAEVWGKSQRTHSISEILKTSEVGTRTYLVVVSY